MSFHWTKWAVVVVLAVVPRLVLAQCMGGSRGGHQHGGEPATKSERKTDKTIRDLLTQESKRIALTEAILADPQFMRDLIDRIVELPEWRALAAERLRCPAEVTLRPDGLPSEGAALKAEESPVYACPMHPEIRSSRPGACPKCGMRLERKGP